MSERVRETLASENCAHTFDHLFGGGARPQRVGVRLAQLPIERCVLIELGLEGAQSIRSRGRVGLNRQGRGGGGLLLLRLARGH
jgi:hypothetical protein